MNVVFGILVAINLTCVAVMFIAYGESNNITDIGMGMINMFVACLISFRWGSEKC